MKLCKELLNVCNIGEAKAKEGDWRITDNKGLTRGKQFTVGFYDKEDGWLPVPQLDSDSEKEAKKKALAYSKKFHGGNGKQHATEIYKGHDESTNEAFDVKKAIQSLIDTDFSASDEEQGKASQLLKGIFFSNEPEAKSLIKKLDKWFSSLK